LHALEIVKDPGMQKFLGGDYVDKDIVVEYNIHVSFCVCVTAEIPHENARMSLSTLLAHHMSSKIFSSTDFLHDCLIVSFEENTKTSNDAVQEGRQTKKVSRDLDQTG